MFTLKKAHFLYEWLQCYLVQHKHCYLCMQTSSALICESCLSDTALPHLPVPGFDLLMQPSIAEHLLPPYYHHFYTLGEYRGILKPLITRLKFGNNPLAAEVLGRFFMSTVYPRLSQFDDLPEAIVPVPLSMWRYMNRGYNQARLIAKAISQLSDIPVLDCLVRVRHTKAQSELDREQRLENIDRAFALNTTLDYQHIAVLDDVVTTGATVNSACQSIVDRYPDIKISVWSMAVTPSNTAKRSSLH